jgi:hypothetical protein
MPDDLDSVKEMLRLYRKWKRDAADKGDEKAVKIYEERIAAFEPLVAEVERLRRVTTPIPASYGDLSDLPPELVKELTGIKVDDLEEQLFTIIKSGDEVDLDAILIELYRRFSVVQTRKFLQNKLWRMGQKEIVYSVPGRKGVYTATKPVEDADEFDALLEEPADQPTAPSKGGFADDLDDDIPF